MECKTVRLDFRGRSDPVRAPRAPRSPGPRLVDAVAALAGPGILAHHRETPWASITYAGTRHTMTWHFAGWEAVDAGEAFLAALPEHEFDIRGALVADVTIGEVETTLLPEPTTTVTAEFLLLDEA